jgi:hypothetical protein
MKAGHFANQIYCHPTLELCLQGAIPVLDNFYFDFCFSPRSICRNEGEKSGVFEYIVAIIYKAKTTF